MDQEILFLVTRNVEEILQLVAAYEHRLIHPASFAASVGELANKTYHLLTGK
jgi:hypothetical protein